MNSLKIDKITVKIDEKTILKNFSLTINEGEIHAIMGPNGTGKSTLAKVIMGDSLYKITKGNIYYNDIDIKKLSIDERAKLGIFLGMQLPPEIEGVTNADFLRSAVSSKMGDSFSLMPFIKKLTNISKKLKMDKEMIHRSINLGFSGGERKKNEILQMYMLEPSMVLLDEIDSGLDVDSLKIVGENVMDYYKEYNPGILVITHYQRLLDYIKPDYVHIMYNGQIIKSGNKDLVKEIETYGYEKIIQESSANLVTES